MFPHNQPGLIRSGLEGHTGIRIGRLRLTPPTDLTQQNNQGGPCHLPEESGPYDVSVPHTPETLPLSGVLIKPTLPSSRLRLVDLN